MIILRISIFLFHWNNGKQLLIFGLQKYRTTNEIKLNHYPFKSKNSPKNEILLLMH